MKDFSKVWAAVFDEIDLNSKATKASYYKYFKRDITNISLVSMKLSSDKLNLKDVINCIVDH